MTHSDSDSEVPLASDKTLVDPEVAASSWFSKLVAAGGQLPLNAVLAFVAGVLVTTMRRPNQYSWPGLWNEEGILVLPQWLADGALSIFRDINGTYPLPTRLLLGLNLQIFPSHFPLANAITAAVVVGAVAAVIVAAPTVLRGRWMILLFVLLIPTDAEVFGVLLYSFWWLSLMALISVLWDPASTRLSSRVVLGWIGALSSPVGAFFGFLGFLRFGFTRSRGDLRAAILTLPACAATVALVAANPRSASVMPTNVAGWSEATNTARLIVAKFPGAWAWSPSGFDGITTFHVVLGVCAVVVVAWAVATRPTDWVLWVLVAGVAGAMAATLLRAPPTLLHPFTAGARYFFFPYVLFSMLMVQIATSSPESNRSLPLRVGASVLVAVALVNTAVLLGTNGLGSAELPDHLGFRRFHSAYDWGEQLAACADGAGIGAFHDGAGIVHTIPIPAEQCAGLR